MEDGKRNKVRRPLKDIMINMHTSTPQLEDKNKVFSISSVSPILEKKKRPGPTKPIAATVDLKKGSIIFMITEAIKTVGLPTKGASFQAIKKWITDQETSTHSLNYRIKKGVLKGLETGILVRSLRSKNAVGAVGFFKLATDHARKIPSKDIPKITSKTQTKNSNTNLKPSAKNPTKDTKRVPRSKKVLDAAEKDSTPPPVSQKRKAQKKDAASTNSTPRPVLSKRKAQNIGAAKPGSTPRHVLSGKRAQNRDIARPGSTSRPVLSKRKTADDRAAKKASKPGTVLSEKKAAGEKEHIPAANTKKQKKVTKVSAKSKEIRQESTSKPSKKGQLMSPKEVVSKAAGIKKQIKQKKETKLAVSNISAIAKHDKTKSSEDESLLEESEVEPDEHKQFNQNRRNTPYPFHALQKDFSDSELEIKGSLSKSFKFSSSDTELEVTKQKHMLPNKTMKKHKRKD